MVWDSCITDYSNVDEQKMIWMLGEAKQALTGILSSIEKCENKSLAIIGALVTINVASFGFLLSKLNLVEITSQKWDYILPIFLFWAIFFTALIFLKGNLKTSKKYTLGSHPDKLLTQDIVDSEFRIILLSEIELYQDRIQENIEVMIKKHQGLISH